MGTAVYPFCLSILLHFLWVLSAFFPISSSYCFFLSCVFPGGLNQLFLGVQYPLSQRAVSSGGTMQEAWSIVCLLLDPSLYHPPWKMGHSPNMWQLLAQGRPQWEAWHKNAVCWLNLNKLSWVCLQRSIAVAKATSFSSVVLFYWQPRLVSVLHSSFACKSQRGSCLVAGSLGVSTKFLPLLPFAVLIKTFSALKKCSILTPLWS